MMSDKHSTSNLLGASLNLSMDLPNATLSTKSISILKMLTGNDYLTIEEKYQKARLYKNHCKFLFGTNHILSIKESDQAF